MGINRADEVYLQRPLLTDLLNYLKESLLKFICTSMLHLWLHSTRW